MRFLAASGLIVIFALSTDAQLAADLAILNANILSEKRHGTEAVAVVGNKIAAIGTNAEIKKLVGERTRVIDARGRLVLPGFNDSHVHFMAIGNLFSALDLRAVKTADELHRQLARYTRFLPKGRWILGGGGDSILWKQIDGAVIDTLTLDNPVLLYNSDAKSAIANSASIKAGNVGNVAAGIVSGPHLDRIKFVVPQDHTKRWADIGETASNYVASFGITSVQDTDSDDHAETYREMARTGKLKVRIYDCHGLPNWKRYADAGLKAATGDSMVRTGCLKGTSDVDEKGKAALQSDVVAADKAGMQVLLHAIGPEMNKVALDAFENAGKVNGKRDRRFRIEHAERAAPADVPRFARLNVIASMQPHLFGWRSRDLSYSRSLQRSGAMIAFGSDAPMTDIDPMLSILAAGFGDVQGTIAGEYSSASAYAEFQEGVKGTIDIGKLADIVILSESSLQSYFQKTDARILFSIVDGKVVFQAD